MSVSEAREISFPSSKPGKRKPGDLNFILNRRHLFLQLLFLLESYDWSDRVSWPLIGEKQLEPILFAMSALINTAYATTEVASLLERNNGELTKRNKYFFVDLNSQSGIFLVKI